MASWPGIDGDHAPLRGGPGIDGDHAPLRGGPGIDGDHAPLRGGPGIDGDHAPLRGGPGIDGDHAPLRAWLERTRIQCVGPEAFYQKLKKQKQNMKAQATFDPITTSLNVSYDSNAQKAFLQAAAKTGKFLRAEKKLESSPASNVQGIACLEAGLSTLTRLGTEPSGQDLTPEELKCAFDACCYTTLYCLTTAKPIEPMQGVVMLLATITPLRVTKIPLPPASEVFDAQTTPQSAWNCFEVIRGWAFPGQPLIFLISLYQLWHELLPVRESTRELARLEEELRHSTGLFRFAMHRLATSEAQPSKNKKERRPKR
jgi:hypothetical protein